MPWSWWSELRQNYRILRRELNDVARQLELQSYQDLKNLADGPSVTRLADGRELQFSPAIHDMKPNGDLEIGIDADGLPTLLGIKPSYHFFKRPDGSVYY